MEVKGTFEVNIEPVKDDAPAVGRMIINKKYSGPVSGIGLGQMLSKRTEIGVAVYTAIEEFEGVVEGKSGAFTLVHNGYMSKDEQNLSVKIIEGSGSGELKSISGSQEIIQEDGKHYYIFKFSL